MLYKKQFIVASIFYLTFLTCFLCVHGSQQHTNTVVCSTSSSESTSYGAVSSMQVCPSMSSHKQKAQFLSQKIQTDLCSEPQDDLDLYALGKQYEEKGEIQQAEACLKEAASNGDRSAVDDLLEFYPKHANKFVDVPRLYVYYLRSIAQPLDDDIDASACRRLGQCYEQGYGVEKDSKKALELYEQADEGGDGIASYLVGECYERGTCGVVINPAMAVEKYKLAARRWPENPSWVKKIYTKLAYCYQNGWGTARDSKKASSHLKTANKAAYLEIPQ